MCFQLAESHEGVWNKLYFSQFKGIFHTLSTTFSRVTPAKHTCCHLTRARSTGICIICFIKSHSPHSAVRMAINHIICLNNKGLKVFLSGILSKNSKTNHYNKKGLDGRCALGMVEVQNKHFPFISV